MVMIVTLLAAGCGGSDTPAPPAAPPPPVADPGPPPPDLPAEIKRGTPTAFEGVDVITMTTTEVLENYTVVVRDGRIETMGPAASTDIPPDAEVLDGTDRFLMPGLADMHVHLVHQENLLLYLANGVTTIRNMWGSPTAILDWKQAIARGTLLGPRIYSASRGLDGNPPAWPETIVVEDAADAQAAVDQEVALGFDFIKVYTSLSATAYDAIVARAAERGIPVVGHVPVAVGVDNALAAGQATTEHLGRYPVGLEGAALQAFAERHAESPTWVSPTMIVRISFVNEEDAAALESRDEMRFVHPDERANWAPNAAAPSRTTQRQASRERGELLRALKDAGVGVLLGTDSWISYVIHGFSIHDELRLLVEDAAFTPYEALAAGTVDAARSVDAEDDWGSIAPGLSADLVLLHDNPLDDVANFRSRLGVMVAGEWLSEVELQRRLEELAAHYGN